MSRLIEILNNYNDWELAFLYKYKMDGYMDNTREKIKTFIHDQRNLSSEHIDKLVEEIGNREFNDKKERCPRCKTDKIRIDKVHWDIPIHCAGAEDELAMAYELQTGQNYMKNKEVCNVCGLIIFDPNKRSFKQKIFGLLFDSPYWSLFRKD